MNAYSDKKQENKSLSTQHTIQKKNKHTPGFALTDNRTGLTAQRKPKETASNNSRTAQLHAIANQKTVQRQVINGINVYIDGANYPVWVQDGEHWHLTMKDGKRWHVTRQDRSMSYWFEVDGGTVTPVNPTKAEFGSHREKHASLSKAPADVKSFIQNHITAIIGVTEKEPR